MLSKLFNQDSQSVSMLEASYVSISTSGCTYCTKRQKDYQLSPSSTNIHSYCEKNVVVDICIDSDSFDYGAIHAYRIVIPRNTSMHKIEQYIKREIQSELVQSFDFLTEYDTTIDNVWANHIWDRDEQYAPIVYKESKIDFVYNQLIRYMIYFLGPSNPFHLKVGHRCIKLNLVFLNQDEEKTVIEYLESKRNNLHYIL